jgi:ubiquinone/menaquinone biosynthesis C-methylase UbiE
MMGVDPQGVGDFVCTTCASPLIVNDGRESADEAIENGTLRCTGCTQTFQVLNGVPRFTGELGGLKETASSYGFQWSGFWNGLFDRGDVFGLDFDRTAEYFLRSLGVDAPALSGKIVLDAGTGSGRVPLAVHSMVGRLYAVDMHSGIEAIRDRLAGLKSVRVVQANLLALPFPDGFFDVAWSSGVLMLMPDASEAFRAVARKVKPGGRIFVSVYGKDVNHYRMFRHLLPGVHKLPTSMVYLLSALIALPLYVGFNTMLWWVRTFRKGPPPHRVFVFTVEDASHKSYKSIVLNLFDQLHPQSQTEHSVEEVLSWFENNGFRDVVVTESIGMVAAHGVKRSKA